MIPLARLISIIAAHSVRGTPFPEDIAKWRRDLAQEILNEIEMDRATDRRLRPL